MPSEALRSRPGSRDPLLVGLTSPVYRLLLAAYPAPFRDEYARWMAQVFHDQCLRAHWLSGPAGMPSLWAVTLLDWLKTLIEQRLMKGFAMSRSMFITVCGWCLVFSDVAIALGLLSSALYSGATDPHDMLYRPYDPWLMIGQLVMFPAWALLTALGLAGLHARFGGETGLVGRAALALGALGGVVAFGMLAVVAAAGDNEPAWAWIAAMVGLLVMFGGLAVFGLAALRGRALAKWSWLPLATGVCFLLGMLLSSSLGSEMWPLAQVLAFGLTTGGLFLLGRLPLREPAGAAAAA